MPLNFATTKAEIAKGELYVHCPTCNGRKHVAACVEIGDGYSPSRWQSFDCGMCGATGQTHYITAAEYVRSHEELEPF